MKGKFVTIEGCEGVGKSTQLSLLKEYCESNGINALFTREPGGCDISEKIRKIILDPSNEEMTDMTELLLYCAARSQHTQSVIIPALNSGVTVFCDRYCDSTAAYQGHARGIDYATVTALNRAAMCGVKIDCTVFLDLEPREGFLRKGGASSDDRLEREKFEFHQKVYEGFKRQISKEPERFAVIDASGSIEQIHRSIISALVNKGILTE